MSRRKTIVVSPSPLADLEVIEPSRYLGEADRFGGEHTVLNLCPSMRYLSEGYYVSLLADARGHDVIPSIDSLEALGNVPEALRVLADAGVPVVREAGSGEGEALAALDPARRASEVSLFGRCERRDLSRIAAKVYRRFPVPACRLSFLHTKEGWELFDIQVLTMSELDEPTRARIAERIRSGRLEAEPPATNPVRATIAVLFDPEDPFKPSWDETIARFEKVAERMSVAVRRIGMSDLDRLAEHDALFIRTLTGPELPAFRFAQRAEALGMPVIDSTRSMLRCGNKVYLAELLERAGVATPDTITITHEATYDEVCAAIGSPFVVKVPDGSFSTAVFKIPSLEAWNDRVVGLLRSSPLLIAQRWLVTPFDWRIGVLDGRPLYGARYWMARGHWQIRKHPTETQAGRDGRTEAIPLEKIPTPVKRAACRAARLIGDGLAGVDIKDTPTGPVVIEVNDNPDIHLGYEDQAEGDRIYEDLVTWFLDRLDPDRPTAPEADAPTDETRRSRPPIGRVRTRMREYRAYEVVGLEVEYVLVDDSLEVVHGAENALTTLAGRPTSEAELGAVAFSNEFFDHLIEMKTIRPLKSLTECEAMLTEGVDRLARTLEEHGVRPMPTSMHPWFDPSGAVRWSRSGRAVYDTYARLFDTSTHGWANVQSMQVNLPLGREHEAVAMMNAAALLIPYLPAIAASSPMYGGALQSNVDNRLGFIFEHQASIPETQGPMVPEYTESIAAYRRNILRPIYHAVDKLPDASAIRHEWLNARGAVFKLSRRSMEVRILDSQECPKMDVAIAAFVRGALYDLSVDLTRGRLALPDHQKLVHDLKQCVKHGSKARVLAPHVLGIDRDADGLAWVGDVTAAMLSRAERRLRRTERAYLEIIDAIRTQGTLSERIAARISASATPNETARETYDQLCDCLRQGRPWRGREDTASA
ncbi:MAG: glutamate-cysteine ligase family protein [Sandaracinaceae bacterium]